MRSFWPCLLLWFTLVEPLLAGNFEDRLGEGIAQRQGGQYHFAVETLQAAREAAVTPTQRARAAGALGQAYYLTHKLQEAEILLRQASESADLPFGERSRYANLLGNVYAGQHRAELAGAHYLQALVWAGTDGVLASTARLNQARLLPEEEQPAVLHSLFTEMAGLPESPEQARLFLQLGEQARALGRVALAYAALDQARSLARPAGPGRLLIESLSALGQLYEQEERIQDALHLVQDALLQAQGGQDHDLLLMLEWQQGRLLQRQGQVADALAAFRRAVEHIEAIRLDIPVEYYNGRSSFRETLAPVYLGLADLLLLEAHDKPMREAQPLLREARDTVELVKQTELEDFLGDRCLVAGARHANTQRIEPDTAVLYPVILADRLELLLDLQGSLRQFTVPVSAAALENATQWLARLLRGPDSEYQAWARQLYQWLIAPLDPDLRKEGIHTLVIVPDGALRLIPLAALYDGEHFLIERYALATSPALTLSSGSSFEKKSFKSLLAGMSEPGPVVTRLPWSLLSQLLGEDGRSLAPADSASGTRSLFPAARGVGSVPKLDETVTRDLMRNPELQARLKERLSLPGVRQEIADLRGQTDYTLCYTTKALPSGVFPGV